MNRGSDNGIDCVDVIKQVYVYLDGELDEVERTEVRIHLDDCGPCLRQYGIEQEVKALVARCCGNDVAPESLRERLRVKLRETSVEIATLEYRPD